MSDQITTNRSIQFSSDVTFTSQQMLSAFMGTSTIRSVTGKQSFHDYVGVVELSEKEGRNTQIQYSNTPHNRRMLIAKPYYYADHIDKEDEVRTIAEWTNPYFQAASFGAARKIDSVFVDAALGTAKGGEDGSSSFSLAAANQVAASVGGADTGLNTPKVARGRRILLNNHWDARMGLHLGITSIQEEDLITEVVDTGSTSIQFSPATSRDFGGMQPSGAGQISSYMGIMFHYYEDLPVDSGDDRRCIMYARDAMLLGIQQPPQGAVERDMQFHYAWQVYYKVDVGAVRMQESGVVEMFCDEG